MKINLRVKESRQWLETKQAERLQKAEAIAKFELPGFSPSGEYLALLRRNQPMTFLAMLAKMEKLVSNRAVTLREFCLAS